MTYAILKGTFDCPALWSKHIEHTRYQTDFSSKAPISQLVELLEHYTSLNTTLEKIIMLTFQDPLVLMDLATVKLRSRHQHFSSIVIHLQLPCFQIGLFLFQCSLEWWATWCCGPISCDIQRSAHWTQWSTQWPALVSIGSWKIYISRLWRVSFDRKKWFKKIQN